MPNNKIQLVIQAAENGNRRAAPGSWTPKSKLSEVMATLESELVGVSLENATLRHINKTFCQSTWSEKTLKDIGVNQGGPAVLVLKLASSKKNNKDDSEQIREPKSNDKDITIEKSDEQNMGIPHDTTMDDMDSNNKEDSQDANMAVENDLEKAIQTLLQSNFDADTQTCVVTIIKVLDNILQKPQNRKVRSIRLANAAFSKKVVERKGGVEFLIACGFQIKEESLPLLSKEEEGEKYLIIAEESEDTAHIVKARCLLAAAAINDLSMGDEELPKYKPPPPKPTGNHSERTNVQEFNPFKGNRFDAKSAAIGQKLGPGDNYVSITEKKVQELQSQQKKLEESMHNKVGDREISAFLPNTASVVMDPSFGNAAAAAGQSDGYLLAKQFQKREQDRQQREEGGFTTKAMRDLQKLKKQKVYSHAQLRIQFSDGSTITAKFLPKEKVEVVYNVIKSTLLHDDFDFDLYVAPPRRKLIFSATLEEEDLVPAAKIFVSWKSNTAPDKNISPGAFLKAEFFQEGSKPSYPSSQAIIREGASKKKSQSGATSLGTNESREEEMLKRMLGKGGRRKPKKDSASKSGLLNKPKWFNK
mmetsp:Transcript_14638/g.21591  ORF Transcript_14638/g.21591 Transcript_14638/m.21591 type:complete len:588 (+) Transcript_14638:71-1834(+)|eukprot:CAMPEP_0194208846 /NCGR_PEP_ID=MMETSP0156-20130528/7176_1 /TAXON_ID=33649 /ORGANISM="Thalassionema nitzschioides, Strain L26-B" /LENGTH=587 /DNA_ID=CAMNT_0038935893 /DNA_START=17 /DNA_END=1780 /DNA_ORIENTATION=+